MSEGKEGERSELRREVLSALAFRPWSRSPQEFAQPWHDAAEELLAEGLLATRERAGLTYYALTVTGHGGATAAEWIDK